MVESDYLWGEKNTKWLEVIKEWRGGTITELGSTSHRQKKKVSDFFLFFPLILFLFWEERRTETSNNKPVFVWMSLKNPIHNNILPFQHGGKEGGKNPIPWRRHQRHVPACFLKVLLKHVQRPHPPIGKPIPNEVRRLQTGLWLSLDSATARWAQRYGPASISHLAFAHWCNLTQL